MPTQDLPGIALVAEDVSLQMGPAAARPLHYFRCLRERGVDVHVVTREQHRDELVRQLAGEEERIHCVADPKSAEFLGRFSLLLPEPLRSATQSAAGFVRQRVHRRVLSQLVRKRGVRIVHQVTPERPRTPSRIYGLGVPVVMGPLLEVTDAPPNFRETASFTGKLLGLVRRFFAALVQKLSPGRRRADVLLVANARSSRSVPVGARGRKLRLAADAVELQEWKAIERDPRRDVPEFIFVGRLNRDSGVDLLLDAFRLALDATPARLRIVGEGPLQARIESRIDALELRSHVECCGWLDPEPRRAALEQADALVFPGLRDTGAGIVMQAMCLGIPVVATDWGTPSEYAGDGAGLLVGPRTRRQFTHELANVIHRLASSAELRREIGERGQHHAQNEFDWSHRVDRLMDVYRLVDSASPQRSALQ